MTVWFSYTKEEKRRERENVRKPPENKNILLGLKPTQDSWRRWTCTSLLLLPF